MTLSDLVMETLKEVILEEEKAFSINGYNSQNAGAGFIQSGKKRVITEAFINEELKAGRRIDIQQSDIITPLAKDMLLAKGII